MNESKKYVTKNWVVANEAKPGIYVRANGGQFRNSVSKANTQRLRQEFQEFQAARHKAK